MKRPGGGRLRPDTFRQQRLTAALARHGIEGGWRAYLLACREQGMSAARIARHLARTFNVDLDDSTLTLWIKQAQQAADNQRGDERPPSGGSEAGGPSGRELKQSSSEG